MLTRDAGRSPTLGRAMSSNTSSEAFETEDARESHPEIVEALRQELQKIKDKEPGDEFPDEPKND